MKKLAVRLVLNDEDEFLPILKLFLVLLNQSELKREREKKKSKQIPAKAIEERAKELKAAERRKKTLPG